MVKFSVWLNFGTSSTKFDWWWMERSIAELQPTDCPIFNFCNDAKISLGSAPPVSFVHICLHSVNSLSSACLQFDRFVDTRAAFDWRRAIEKRGAIMHSLVLCLPSISHMQITTSCRKITMDASLYTQQAFSVVPVYEKTPRLAEIVSPLHHSLRSETSFHLHF